MKSLMKSSEFSTALEKLAGQLLKAHANPNEIAIVGIHTRGVPLAQRLVKLLKQKGHDVSEGMLDINLYRDDLSEIADQPVLKETNVEFDLTNKVVYLVDDVLYTGRTIRAAMDALFDLGRPKAVHLLVWAKRSGRELPIDTEFCVLNIETKPTDNIKVKFMETDGKDDVTLLEKGEY